MNWNVRVITAPSRDTDLSLMVIFDQDKYLINCGEGTQRSCTQRGVGFRKLGTVLLTNSSSDVIGGLPGILMSSADTGIPEIKIAGPEAALQYLVSSRTFCQREKFSVEWLAHPTDSSQVLLEKSHLSIRAIPLSSIDAAPSFPTPHQDWEWRDLELKLDELSQDQLAGWRRTVLEDMFKKNGNLSGRAPGPSTSDPSPANDTVPSVDDAIPAIPPSLLAAASTSDDHIPKPIRQHHPARMHIPQSIPHPAHPSSSQTTTVDPDLRYAYILQAPSVRGKFDIKKAKALGVPNGPVRKILIDGGQIEVDDAEAEGGKRVIKAEDVLGETQDGGSFIMVDVTASHLPRLLQDPAFKEYQSTESNSVPSKQARLVVHRITDEVMQDERYMAWVRSFGKDTNHVLANVDRFVDSVTYTSSARNLLKLNILDKDIFQLVHIEDKGDQSMSQDDSPFIPAQPHMITRIFPPSPPQVTVLGESDPGYPAVQELQSAQKLVMEEMPEYADLVKKAWEKTAALGENSTVEDDFGMVVTPLGTGSAIPSKYRNVSATIVEIPDFGNILLDAGEGTLGQMHRRYGSELWPKVLSKTKIMVISHMHADHHIGLRRVLEERLKHNPTEMLYIIAPSFIALHLIENGMSLDDESHKICFIDTYHLRNGVRPNSRSPSPTPSPERTGGRFEAVSPSKRRKSARQEAFHRARDCLRELDLECIHTPEVEHRGRAYGFALTHRSGWKIAYSGDTMPCDDLVEAGQGATLLIHEATLDDDNVVMAVMKAHSTFGQAVEVGKRMGAKYILLNHFSQRYPKLPRYQPAPGTGTEAANSEEPKIALAFDLMTLPLKSFEKATSYTDAMEVLFKEDEAEEGETVDEEAQDNNAKPKAQNKQSKAGGQKKSNGQQANVAQATASGELSQNQQKKQDRKEHRAQQKKAAIALAADALPEPEVISAAAGLPIIAQDSVGATSTVDVAAQPVGDPIVAPSAEMGSGNSQMTGITSDSTEPQENVATVSETTAFAATASPATESMTLESTLVNDVQTTESPPITGEKRQNEGEDVDMERGPIKRTKSETTGVTLDGAR